MKTILSTLIAIFLATNLWSQTSSKLNISIESENKTPLDGANVVLLNTDGKTLVKQVISDTKGMAFFENISPKKYIVKVVLIGYLPFFK